MTGTWEVFRKELSDHFTSYRIIIIVFLIYVIGFTMSYEAVLGVMSELKRTGGEAVFLGLFTTQRGLVPSFLSFIAFFGPIIGLILVFDAINREESSGTLGMILSQPIHRDSLINGKFGAVSLTIFLLLSSVFVLMVSIGISFLGTFPSVEEILRITTFLLLSSVYLSTWAAIGILYSILFKREGTSALASISTWLFFTLFIYMLADMTSSGGGSAITILYLSPSFIYTQASSVLLYPAMRILGPVTYEKIYGMIPNPLPFSQSVLLIWPYLTFLTAAMLIVFIISYVKFVRQEVRST